MRRSLGILLLVGASACGILGLGEYRVVGMIDLDVPLLVPLVMPDTVTAGVDFSVVVSTIGGGCTRAGDTETTLTGNTAIITPYDFIKRRGPCLDFLIALEHPTTLRFERVGQARVLVRAVDRVRAPLEIEHSVVVR